MFGLNQNFGGSGAQLLIMNGAWFVAFAAFQPLLWLIRAVRRWRLESTPGEASAIQRTATSQFSLRALLGWMLAVAFLLAALRWLTPAAAVDAEEMFQLAPEAGLMGLLIALGGLPAIALAWVVLADGRRLVLRIVLSLLIVSGLAGACYAIRVNGSSPTSMIVLLESGAMFNALVSLGVIRACGYWLRCRSKNVAGRPCQAVRPRRPFRADGSLLR